ncbi:MAG TPA: two-component regulator propeller domain-containing protein [Candidatus Nitrosotalea sp.]|nr:two-component regulator propeller domain-containing protein [Candidatus Nitrosotalea sp.]
MSRNDSYVKEYSLPSSSAPNGLVVDKSGLVWVTSKNATLYSVDPKSGQVKNYEIKDGKILYENPGVHSVMVWAIVQDSDGKIWFSPLGTTSIWKFDPQNGAFDSYESETGAPFQMKASLDGKIWFTTLRGDTIGVIEKSQNDSYVVSTFGTVSHANPAGIFLQNDSVWVANVGSQNIIQYKIDQDNHTVKNISIIRKIPQDNTTVFSSPTDLFVDKNALWLTEHGTSFLTNYDLDSGKITRYPTSQNTFSTTTLPFWIRGTNDPKVLWFNEHQGNKIGRFDISNKTLTEYSILSLPTDGYLTYPLNISQDPLDEKILWFSEWNTDKIAVINGHVPIPFEINLNTTKITLNRHGTTVLDLKIMSYTHNSDKLFLNASSSITPTAALGNLTVQFSANMLTLPHNGTLQLTLSDGGVDPGNYTVGIGASDGLVTITKFLDLSILSK